MGKGEKKLELGVLRGMDCWAFLLGFGIYYISLVDDFAFCSG